MTVTASQITNKFELFVQQLAQGTNKETLKLRIADLLLGESTSHSNRGQ